MIQHRKAREAAILGTLGASSRNIADITATVYHDVSADMHPAAARNVFAHLIDLVERNLVTASPELSLEAGYRKA